jgi:sec-independent protein translocase protein TatA
MGLGGISIGELLIVLVIVVLIFGTKRLKSIGSDLGSAIKSFRGAMSDDKAKQDPPKRIESQEPDAEFAEQHEKDKTGRT